MYKEYTRVTEAEASRKPGSSFEQYSQGKMHKRNVPKKQETLCFQAFAMPKDKLSEIEIIVFPNNVTKPAARKGKMHTGKQ